ncbi:MAG: hypothetical protein HZA48_04760 [Planctomycetes bacterium]|nr:hypothetical protein [Planctomycetota bacterium]
MQEIYISRFERRVVGGREHEEFWIPADELNEFNSHIEGCIEVDAAYFGRGFAGEIPTALNLKGKDAIKQFDCLRIIADYSGFDFWCETYLQKRVVYLHYPYWKEHDFSDIRITMEQKDSLLNMIEDRWKISDVPFGLPRLSNQNAE